MAKNEGQVPEKKKPVNEAPKVESKASAHSDICKAEDCKKKFTQFGFCPEHYELYMAGVIRGDGKKPIDFAEKFHQFQKKQVQHKKVA